MKNLKKEEPIITMEIVDRYSEGFAPKGKIELYYDDLHDGIDFLIKNNFPEPKLEKIPYPYKFRYYPDEEKQVYLNKTLNNKNSKLIMSFSENKGDEIFMYLNNDVLVIGSTDNLIRCYPIAKLAIAIDFYEELKKHVLSRPF